MLFALNSTPYLHLSYSRLMPFEFYSLPLSLAVLCAAHNRRSAIADFNFQFTSVTFNLPAP